MSTRHRQQEKGYVLLGIAIGIVILGIFMGAAVPVWQHVMQREREEELMWRGMQYVGAIERYQKKFPGAYPPTVEILVEQKFLRRAYKDPMTEDGEWRIIRQLSPEVRVLPGSVGPQGQPAGMGSGTRGGTRGGQRGQGGSGFGDRRGGAGSFGGQQGGPSSFSGTGGFESRGKDDLALGGMVGVASRSTEKSIKVWAGKETYDQWLFISLPQAAQRPGGIAPGAPGPPGRSGGFPGARGGGAGGRQGQPGAGGPGSGGGGSSPVAPGHSNLPAPLEPSEERGRQ